MRSCDGHAVWLCSSAPQTGLIGGVLERSFSGERWVATEAGKVVLDVVLDAADGPRQHINVYSSGASWALPLHPPPPPPPPPPPVVTTGQAGGRAVSNSARDAALADWSAERFY